MKTLLDSMGHAFRRALRNHGKIVPVSCGQSSAKRISSKPGCKRLGIGLCRQDPCAEFPNIRDSDDGPKRAKRTSTRVPNAAFAVLAHWPFCLAQAGCKGQGHALPAPRSYLRRQRCMACIRCCRSLMDQNLDLSRIGHNDPHFGQASLTSSQLRKP